MAFYAPPCRLSAVGFSQLATWFARSPDPADLPAADCRMDGTWYAAAAHIPGAVRLPAPLLVHPGNGTVRDAAGVRGLLAEAGLDADKPGRTPWNSGKLGALRSG
jgi:3-mercaptopyruvate sulfurtransferase SseA